MSIDDKVKIIKFLTFMESTNTNPYIDGRLYLFLNKNDNFVSTCPQSYSKIHNMYTTAEQKNIQFKKHLTGLKLLPDKTIVISVGLFYHDITFINNKFDHDTSVVKGQSCLAIIRDNTLEIMDSNYENLPQFKYFERRLISGLGKNLRMLSGVKTGSLLVNTTMYNIQQHTNTDSLCLVWSFFFSFLLHSHNWTRQQLIEYVHDVKSTLLNRLFYFLDEIDKIYQMAVAEGSY